METKILIVGAGIAGLSTGYYARLNGFDTVILEAQATAGGLCAAWTRKGYTFDISMHLLTNSRSGPIRLMWEELGVVGERKFHYHDAMYTVEGRGKRLVLWTDRDRLYQALVSLSPEDAGLAREFVDLFCGPDIMGSVSLKAPELWGPLDFMRMVPSIVPIVRAFRRYGKTTVQEFAARFHDPFLREAIRMSVDNPGWPMPRFPMAVLSGFASTTVANAGVPIGGSNRAVRGIAERYERLGGSIRYKSRVADILLDGDRATGVRLGDGSEVPADIVVWAADGHHLIFDILGGRYVNEEIRKMYSEWIPVKPLVQVMVGAARDMTAEPARLALELEKPIAIAGEYHGWISVLTHAFDPTSAPKGKTAVEVWFATTYGYWEVLAADRTRYKAEKQRIADESVAALERRWPGFAAQVEVVEVATPATYVRYTGNWQGSPDGWYVTVDNVRKRSVLRSLPGLDGLYTVGQWTAPFTGTVMAALSGRQLTEILCRKERRPFLTCAQTAVAG